MSEYNGLEVEEIDVIAVVKFRAFVQKAGPEHGITDEDERKARIEYEIADAVEYRAPHLTDSEDTDALIAMSSGGHSSSDVDVAVTYRLTGREITDQEIEDAVEGTAAWL